MLLHRTPLMELHYEPQTDILKIVWPDLKDASQTELENTFQLIKDSIKHYFIKKLLIDSSQATYIPGKEEHFNASMLFAKALSETSLSKVARITSQSSNREKQTAEITERVQAAQALSMQFQNFNSEMAAEKWLLEE